MSQGRLLKPVEVKSKDEFTKLLEGATGVRVVREGDNAKLKLRTKKALYTFKTTGVEADDLTKGLKIEVEEF